jgi:rSAM/selenodomain-associated transferase 1
MKRALLCFLKYPEPGHVKTRLAAELGSIGASNLYRSLAERVITEVYPLSQNYQLIICFDPKHNEDQFIEWLGDQWIYWPQEGHDLGNRMANAVAQALEEGFDQAILLGSDCIELSETFIEDAFKALDDYRVVIGPSTDGGYYLLGLSHMDDFLFDDMAWSTDSVLPTTIDRLEAREYNFKLLEEKIDIDTEEDLTKLREQLPEEHFIGKKVDQIVLERLSIPEGADELF